MTDWRIYERDVDLLLAEEFYAVRDMTISTCCIGQATDQISKLVDEALGGQQVTITRQGKPVVELRPATPARRRVT